GRAGGVHRARRPGTRPAGAGPRRRRLCLQLSPRDVMPAVSPNHSARRDGLTPALIVIHYTGMVSLAEARARLCDPAAEVSAHWLIAPDGTAEALVPETLRAWHGGAGSWRGMGDINSRSIGIELHNQGDRPFPQPQMQALE